MCFIEAFAGLNFILSICAVCVASFAPGGPIDSSMPLSSFLKLQFKKLSSFLKLQFKKLSSFLKLQFKGYRSPFRKRKK